MDWMLANGWLKDQEPAVTHALQKLSDNKSALHARFPVIIISSTSIWFEKATGICLHAVYKARSNLCFGGQTALRSLDTSSSARCMAAVSLIVFNRKMSFSLRVNKAKGLHGLVQSSVMKTL